MSKDIAIGIDFGTNFVCAGALVNGKVEIIPNEHENRLTPAYVAFTEDERLFGESAKHQAPINPDNTFYNVKQLAGRLTDDPVVNNIQIMVGYPITGNEAHQIKIPLSYEQKTETQTLHPEQVIAMIIERMRKLSESHLNASVKRAVISVPSSFSNAQRQATLNAGEIAGFEDIKLISDSAAAALAYAFDGQANQEKKIIILDFGGGSLDISLATIHGPLIQIVWSYGDCSLGGESIDYELIQHFGKEFNIKTEEKRNLIRLKNSCEKLKRNLSVAFQAHSEVDIVSENKSVKLSLNRDEFEKINKNLFEKVEEIIKEACESNKLRKEEIDDVILVGGSSRIPKIRAFLKQFFSRSKFYKSINPDEAMACGAAIQAGIVFETKEIENFRVSEVYPHSVSVSGKEIVAMNSKFPLEIIHELPKKSNDLKVYENLDYSVEPLLISHTKLPESNQKQIKVTFRINYNGILDITPNGVIFKSETSGLNIEHLIDKNKEFDEIDMRMQRHDEVKNNFETFIYGQIQNIPCLELSDTHKDKISKLCNDMLEWLENHQSEKNEMYENKKEEFFQLKKECEEEGKKRDILKNYIKHVSNAVQASKYNFSLEDSTKLIDLCTNGEETSRNHNTTHGELQSTLKRIQDAFSKILRKLEKNERNINRQHNVESGEIPIRKKNVLSEYVEYVRIESKKPDLKLEPADKKQITDKCDSIETWIKENPEAKQETLEKEKKKLEIEYETIFKPVVEQRQKKEQKNKTALKSLKKYRDNIIQSMEKHGSNMPKGDKDEICEKCRSIQVYLEQSQKATAEEYENMEKELEHIYKKASEKLLQGNQMAIKYETKL